MELWEATAIALRQIERAMFEPRRDTRRCEMCDDVMGEMTLAAYLAAHRHCEMCERDCEECQEEARA